MRCSTFLCRTVFAFALLALPFTSVDASAKAEAEAKAPAKAPAKASGKAEAKASAKAPAKAEAKKTTETQDEVETKLISFAQAHVNRANQTLRPNRATPEVRNEQGQYIARYLEVDTASLKTEIYPSNTPGCAFVGHVVYIEKVYECVAASKKDVGKGPFVQTKSRRIRELTRYDQGKWHY